MSIPVYTIGYTAFPELPCFFSEIQKNGIEVIIDVRSKPYSEHFPQFNRESMEETCSMREIYYRSYANEFGARKQDTASMYPRYLSFPELAKQPAFDSGCEKIVRSVNAGFVMCLMCAETDPINCHRAIMIGKALKERGLEVRHILPNGALESQTQLESRLLQTHFPDAGQMSLLDTDPLSNAEMLEQAYRMQGAEIQKVKK